MSFFVWGLQSHIKTSITGSTTPFARSFSLFSILGKGRVFLKVNMKQALQQLVMGKKSQAYCTSNTHLGSFRSKRLPYDVASSPVLWQQTVDMVFSVLPGVFSFIGNILLAGKDKNEHQKMLISELKCIQENDIRTFKSKCQFHILFSQYLGFIITHSQDHDKVRAVQLAKEIIHK